MDGRMESSIFLSVGPSGVALPALTPEVIRKGQLDCLAWRNDPKLSPRLRTYTGRLCTERVAFPMDPWSLSLGLRSAWDPQALPRPRWQRCTWAQGHSSRTPFRTPPGTTSRHSPSEGVCPPATPTPPDLEEARGSPAWTPPARQPRQEPLWPHVLHKPTSASRRRFPLGFQGGMSSSGGPGLFGGVTTLFPGGAAPAPHPVAPAGPPGRTGPTKAQMDGSSTRWSHRREALRAGLGCPPPAEARPGSRRAGV